jgi:hypothetical protein
MKQQQLAFDDGSNMQSFAHDVMAFDRDSLRTFDVDGRLHVEKCNISKATVNPYYGREIPGFQELGLEPDKVYNLYRHPEELEKAAPTFNNLQLLDLHTAVDASDPKMDRTCGTIGSDVAFDGKYLTASIAVWTQPAIELIKSKKAAQLSSSYRYFADMTPGVTSGGVAFDGIMRNIIGNHVALVEEGRAGPEVCVSDSLPVGLKAMKHSQVIATIATVIPTLTAAQRLALDAAFDKKAKDDKESEDCSAMDAYEREEAMDSREEEMDAREEESDKDESDEKARGDRKKARDARAKDRAKRARDRKSAKDKAKDENVEEKAEDKASDKANDVALAIDAALNARIASGKLITAEAAQKLASDAVAKVEGIAKAKQDVIPLVGVVTAAMDSAESIYRFALDQVKVDHKDVHPSALSALVSAEIRARKHSPRPAFDAAASNFHIDSLINDAFTEVQH